MARSWVFAVAACLGLVGVAAALPDGVEPATHLRKRFESEIRCEPKAADVNRSWCPVTRAGLEKLVLPEEGRLYLGQSMSMLDGESVLSELNKNARPAVLCFHPGRGKVTLLASDAALLTAIRKSLEGAASDIVVPASLYEELVKECKVPYTRFGNEFDIDGTPDQSSSTLNGSLWKVGNSYVTASCPSSTRTQISVFAAVPVKPAPPPAPAKPKS